MFGAFATNFFAVLLAIMSIYLTGIIASLIMILLIIGIQKLFGCRTLGSVDYKKCKTITTDRCQYQECQYESFLQECRRRENN